VGAVSVAGFVPCWRALAVSIRDADEALAAGMPEFGLAHEWQNQVGQPARPSYAQALGIPLTGFTQWAEEHLRPADRH
jgi:hypothetical protein